MQKWNARRLASLIRHGWHTFAFEATMHDDNADDDDDDIGAGDEQLNGASQRVWVSDFESASYQWRHSQHVFNEQGSWSAT